MLQVKNMSWFIGAVKCSPLCLSCYVPRKSIHHHYACQGLFLVSKYFLHLLAEIKVSLARQCKTLFLKNLPKHTNLLKHCKCLWHTLVFPVLLAQNQSLNTLPMVISLELIILSPALFFIALMSVSNHQCPLTF